MVEFSYVGEGNSGHFDPTDPDDFPHLRFTIYEMDGWSSSTSYRCAMPVNTKPKVLREFSHHLASGHKHYNFLLATDLVLYAMVCIARGDD